MDQPNERATIAAVRNSLLEACPDTLAVYVFGSHARGDERPDSDLDIAILLPPGRRIPDKLALLAKLTERAGRRVDIVELASAGDVIRAEVLAEGRTIYERDPDQVLAWEATAMSRYAYYREEVADILEQFRRSGVAYSDRPL